MELDLTLSDQIDPLRLLARIIDPHDKLVMLNNILTVRDRMVLSNIDSDLVLYTLAGQLDFGKEQSYPL